jgi:ATP-binding cassette subfamily B protein/ATP-binding cassette subfamily C protein
MKGEAKKRSFIRAIIYSVRTMFRSNPRAAVLVSIGEILQAVVPSAQAVLIGLTLNALVALDWSSFLWLLVVMVGLSMLNGILGHFGSYYSTMLQYDIQNYSTELLYLKVNKISLAVREMKDNADKLEIAESYALSLGWLFPQLLGIVARTFALITAFIVLCNLSWVIAVILLIIMIPNAWLTIKKMRAEREYWKNNSVHRRKGWGIRNQMADQKQTVELRVNGLYEYFVKQWRRHITQDRRDEMSINRRYLPYEVWLSLLHDIAILGALIWAGKLIFDGRLEVGFLMTINGLMDNFTNSAYQVVTSLSSVGSDLLKASDYFAYLDLPEEEDGTVMVEGNRPPKIELRDVTFTYPGSDSPVLKNINLTIEPGRDIAIVGENGSGKTTLIKLLFGLYEPDSGQILVNGIELNKINKASYYRRLGALFQDYARYDFTDLNENIWYGDITRKLRTTDMNDVIAKAKLTSMVAKLPYGLKQILSKRYDDENGTDLSGGQWQRVALARGFWRRPDVLVLDEPTAAVDAKSEYEIFQEIAREQQDKTTIIISHRFSTVRKAEKIYVIDDGRIVESGSHQQLMKIDGGLYSEMFSLQAEGYLTK